MELFRLRTFATVAKRQSISAAAEELHLSQPAITRQMQALEKTIGLRLLERQGRATLLTPTGKVLLHHVQLILQAVDNCTNHLEDLRLGRRGKLAVGAGLTTISFILPTLIQAYKRQLPDIELSITNGTTQEILQLILERRIDLGFITSPIKHPNCIVRPLFDDQIVLISNAEQKLAGISISKAELAELPLILYGPSGFHDFVEKELLAAEITPRVAMELDSIEGIKRMVVAGVGHAFVPKSAVLEELAEKRLVETPVRGLPNLVRQTCLLYLRQESYNFATEIFLDIVQRQWPRNN